MLHRSIRVVKTHRGKPIEVFWKCSNCGATIGEKIRYIGKICPFCGARFASSIDKEEPI
jgi:DNA-directed RNA polymerase subunit RPC12/RpoP